MTLYMRAIYNITALYC